MGRVGRQSDPDQEVRPAGSPRLHLLVCTACWQRPWSCGCGEQKRSDDGQHVTSPGWQRLPVFTEGDVRAAIEEVTKDRDLAFQVAAQLATTPEPDPDGDRARRRPGRSVGSTREQGRVVA